MSKFGSELVPKARSEDLLIETLDGEVLVYDLRVHEAICLNASAALIWDLSDGRRTIADIVNEVGNAEITYDHVAQTLDLLREKNLLEDDAIPGAIAAAVPASRRFFLGHAVAASLVLPTVMATVVPSTAQTIPGTGDICTDADPGTPATLCPPNLVCCDEGMPSSDAAVCLPECPPEMDED